MEDLLAAPFYNNIAVTGKGNRAAWLCNERGVRNIQMAESPDWKVHTLTAFTDDNGLEISDLKWNPDGSTLFFVQGNSPQVRATQPHNPAHLLGGTAPVIWQLTPDNAQPTKIGPGTAPTFSPDGQRLVFLRAGQVWIKNLSDTISAKQLCQVRNGAANLVWSPDGNRLAFVSGRGEAAYVAVYDFKRQDYQFLEPGIDRDADPAWSPDGQQLAFIRQPRPMHLLIFSAPIQEVPAWSIRVADANTGKVRTLFTADAGKGSAYHPHTGKQQLLWCADDDHLYFCWEKTGWQQLYRVPAKGGDARPVTQGAFEVDEVYLSNDRRTVLFNSNQNDMERKHLWRFDPARDREPTALTSGKGIESQVNPADGNQPFFTYSDGKTPVQVARLSGNRIQQLTALSAAFPVAALVEPESVPLKAKDGFQFYNQLFFPKNLKQDRSHPALIFIHGGSRRQMLMGYHPSLYYANAYHLSQYFAAKGYVVAHINYRSGIGYGRDFREAPEFGVTGASEFRDLEALGEWLKQHPAVNPGRVVVWGGSYGGYLTAHALARRSDLFAAGADVHGVHNWNTAVPTFTPEYDSLSYPQIGRLAYQSSPLYYLDGWRAPVLLIHGDDDANVNFRETVTLQKHLRQRKVETELLVIPDEVHSFLRFRSWLRAYSAIDDFFERKNGGR